MSARSVCSGTRPSRYHSMRAISAPPRRPEQLMRMPSAPRRIADCTARFMARRKATRRSSCCAIDSATSCASSSGLRISTMLMTTSLSVILATTRAQLLDVGALLADDHAGTRRMDGDAALLVRALDDDARHRRLLELLHQLVADLDVFVQQRAVFVFARIPAGVPGAVDAETQADRIDFLTHRNSLGLSRFRLRLDLAHDDGQVGKRLENAPHAAAAARA